LTWAALAQAQWVKYFVMRDPVWLTRTNESLREAQKRDLDTALAHLVSGRLAANSGVYRKAESEDVRAIDLDPNNADTHRRLGQVYENTGRFDLARKEFLKAVEVEPQYFVACQDLGWFYFDRGELQAAATEFERCVKLAPDEPDAHRVLGLVYKNLKRYSKAEEELRKAVELSPMPTADTLATLGQTLMYQRREPEALFYLKQATILSPGQSLLWMDLGIAYSRTGSTECAMKFWRVGQKKADQELMNDPVDAEASARLAYFWARLRQPDRAAAEIGRALQLAPDSNDVRETAILTWESLKRSDKSLEVLSNSDDQVFDFVERWPDLADLYNNPRFQDLRRTKRGETNGK
jgi:Flp pilus assembly protein TadD